MKFVALLFVLLAYATTKAMIINDLNTAEVEFPVLTIPTFEFIDLSLGCAGFFDCTEYVGAVLYNMVLGIIFLVLLIVELLVYIVAMFATIFSLAFTGIEGAPEYINLLITVPMLAMLGMIIYKLIRAGSSND
jgi:hypothetical protein